MIEACGAVRTLTKEIYAPQINEQVQIGQHTNSYSISLSEELLSSVKMSNVSLLKRCVWRLSSLFIITVRG